MLDLLKGEADLHVSLRAMLQIGPDTEFPGQSARIYVYGAGSYGRKVGHALEAAGYTVFAYVDDKAVGRELNGRIVVGSSALMEAGVDDWLLLALLNRDVNLALVHDRLARRCAARIETPPQFVSWLEDPAIRYFWLTDRASYLRMTEDILSGANVWADSQSRNAYLCLWLYRLSGDSRWLPTPDLSDQYLPADLKVDIDCRVFVDCGAYDGDTLSYLMRVGRTPERWFAFEPEARNFDHLMEFVAAQQRHLGEVFCWPCGVWSESTQLRFAAARGEASSLSEQGETMIQCVALDDVIGGVAPSYIKMDVEGAEWQALRGGERLLAGRPALALSAYHRPEDIWYLPKYLASLSLDYRFHLRLHGHQGFDAVLYAIPARGSA